MEHFNETDYIYFKELRKKHKVLKLKIELLSELENAIGEITKYFSKGTNGQININYQQLLRRSCSLTIANIDKQLLNMKLVSVSKFNFNFLISTKDDKE